MKPVELEQRDSEVQSRFAELYELLSKPSDYYTEKVIDAMRAGQLQAAQSYLNAASKESEVAESLCEVWKTWREIAGMNLPQPSEAGKVLAAYTEIQKQHKPEPVGRKPRRVVTVQPGDLSGEEHVKDLFFRAAYHNGGSIGPQGFRVFAAMRNELAPRDLDRTANGAIQVVKTLSRVIYKLRLAGLVTESAGKGVKADYTLTESGIAEAESRIKNAIPL